MDEQRQQQIYMRASLIEKESQEVQHNIELISKELEELSRFGEQLQHLSAGVQTPMFSSVGKGVHIKTMTADNGLYVDVGAGILVRKTIPQTKEIIHKQMHKLEEAHKQLLAKVEIYTAMLHELLHEAEHTH